MSIMNKLRRDYLAWFLGASLFAFGCDGKTTKREYSDILHEDAQVTKKVGDCYISAPKKLKN